MKKFLIVLLLLIPITTEAYYYQWDDDVIAVYDFEQNGNDTLGNYNLTTNGIPVYSNTVTKSGSYSYYHPSTSDYFQFPTDLTVYLRNATEWSIEFNIYDLSAGSYNIPFSRGQDWGLGSLVWNPQGIGNVRGQLNSGWFSFTNDESYNINKWYRVSIQWKSDQNIKWYLDGVLILNAGANPFVREIANNVGDLWLGRATGCPPCVLNGYMDKVIISNKLYNGAEILPIGISETKYFTPEEIIYFGADQMYYDGE